MLTPSINVFSSNLEGNALSFLSVGAEVNLAKRFGNHGLATINAAKRDYDKENPIFNKTREDKDFAFIVMNMPISLMQKLVSSITIRCKQPRRILNITNRHNMWFQ
ncbi:DUF2860 family protein [Vibrio lentus]|nr:DUF2860 family protein [Vibrio lentus]